MKQRHKRKLKQDQMFVFVTVTKIKNRGKRIRQALRNFVDSLITKDKQ